jgi:hypothetical protein
VQEVDNGSDRMLDFASVLYFAKLVEAEDCSVIKADVEGATFDNYFKLKLFTDTEQSLLQLQL